MAPLPKRRHSTRRGGKRKAAIKLKAIGLDRCPNCGVLRIPHIVCKSCGFYNGKEVIKQKKKSTTKKK